jgi:uncharacterized protein (TIGR02391 family)
MTRRAPQQPRHADLSIDQIRAAIPRFKARIEELRNFDVGSVQERGDPRLTALRDKVQATVSDVFGADTVEAHQFGYVRLDEAPMVMGMRMPPHVIRQGYAEGIERTVAKLQAVIELLEEKLGTPGGDAAARARRAFGDLDLHPEVGRAVGKLFEDGHYANAVEDACKVLDGLVKLRSGRNDLSGTELMQAVFSPNKPLLKFNDLKSESDKSEQQGMMFLYAGAMLALRNPRAHGLVQDGAEGALEYIAFVSMLAKALDRAKK